MHKEDGNHFDRKHILTGGHRVGHPGFKLQLCHQGTSENWGKHVRLIGFQFTHVRNKKLGTMGFSKVLSDILP